LSAPLIPARLRKFIGGIGILVFLAAWIWVFTSLYDFLPDNRAVQLIYFVVAGLGWGLPLMPLMSWMGKADKPVGR
jgi:Trk-type K+ transport system membrane component